ncbi:MAG: prenyltransferase/squalene oxidase repeat-containing protein [Gemmataceae bacterium]
MATVSQDTGTNNGRQTSAPSPTVMIRQMSIAYEGEDDRFLKRQVPAWVISGGIHLLLISAFLISAAFNTPIVAPPPENVIIETKVEDAAPEKQNFENTDVGLDPSKETNYNLDRIENISVPGQFKPDEPVGIVGAPEGAAQTIPPPAGFGGGQGGGAESAVPGAAQMFGDQGGFMGGRAIPGMAFAGRSGATRQKMLAEGGGNAPSEAAVAKGLQWLVKMQKNDGRWDIDGNVNDSVAGTALALLPFLAAGHTHKTIKGEKESPYAKTVEYGLSYIKGKQKANGSYGNRDLYGHAIATMALCEAYGMSQDPSLKRPAQSGLDYLVKAQHQVGGFRYTPNQAGDTSVTGWCLQCMKSGLLAGLSVPREAFYKVSNYLDTVQTQEGAAYGYTGPGNTSSMTAVGLLCREYLGWGPKNPKLVAGVENLKKNMPRKGLDNIYYYYYATQVMHFFGGDDWDKLWNPKMRDLLIDTQDNTTTANRGSWTPDRTITGTGGGRLTSTCLSLLTLEVYYRHLPLYKRDNSGLKELDG